ncbi:MAG TPA: hypothetical protein VGK89_02625 [Candidatus Eisenbacteria bacterium]|jgi:hypothetical protein
MNSETLERLMNDVLDGVATPEERALLERHLETDPAARARHRELQGVFELLARVPMEDPPPELRTEVSLALAASSRTHGPARRAPAWTESMRAAFVRRPGLGAASAFAAGALAVAIAVLALTRSLGPAAPGLPVSGTMARPAPGPESLLDTREARVEGATFTITTRRGGDPWTVELAVRAAAPTEIELEFDPERLAVEDVHWSAPAEVHATPGRVRLGAGADVRYRLAFRARGEPSADLSATLRSGKGSAKEVLRMTPGNSIP